MSVDKFIVSTAPLEILSASQCLDHISRKSNMIFASLIKGFLFVFYEEETHVGNVVFFFPTVI